MINAKEGIDEVLKDLKETEPFRVEDLSEIADKYLNDAAKKALEVKTTQLLDLGDNGKVFGQVIYLGTRVLITQVEEGVKRISERLNELADKGFIMSCLTKMIQYNLARLPFEEETCIIVSYVKVPGDQYELLSKGEYSFDSGGVPPIKEDYRMKLGPDECGATINIAGWLNMNPTLALERELNVYLALLPIGTRIKKVTACAVTGLQLPYEVIFTNDAFDVIKKVELEYMRSFSRPSKTRVHEFNVLTGIKYFNADGNEMFKRQSVEMTDLKEESK